MKWIIFFILFGSLASCTQLSKEACENIDWHQQGKADAMKGYSLKSLGRYKKRCEGHGVPVDNAVYKKGHQDGLKLFCTSQNGEYFGKRGLQYQYTCPTNLEPTFLQGYQIGRKYYELAERERSLEERENLLRANSNGFRQECTFDSDCTLRRDCTFGSCRGTGKSCTFDSECEIRGQCDVSRYCRSFNCKKYCQY